jgi:hypothetical protein
VLWNQTLLSVSLKADPQMVSGTLAVAGIDAKGDAIFRYEESLSDFSSFRTRLLKLDASGNVVWARELPPGEYVSEMHVLSDGSSIIVHTSTPDMNGNAPDVVEKLDAEGNSTWRAALDSNSVLGASAFDDQERVIFSATGDRAKTARPGIPVVVFDRSGPACTRHVLPVPLCDPHLDGGPYTPRCGTFSMAAVGAGRVYFGIANQVGVAQLP